MRSVDGIVALREIARRFGPVRIDHVPANEPDPWTVSLDDRFSHEHGSSLERTAVALLDDLERGGPVTLAEAGAMTQMARGIRFVIQRFAPSIGKLDDNVLGAFEQIVGAFYLDLKGERERRERRSEP